MTSFERSQLSATSRWLPAQGALWLLLGYQDDLPQPLLWPVAPQVWRRRDQGPPGLRLHDGTWRRAVHEAHHTGRVGALVYVYLEPVPGLQVYVNGIETDLFAGIIAHATLGTL